MIARATPSRTRMNKTETTFAQRLEILKRAGEIRDWMFEPMGLRLAQKTFYHPDFLVVEMDYTLTIWEIKGGFIRDDSIVKLKTAAKMFPFRFRMAQLKAPRKGAPGQWTFKEIPG